MSASEQARARFAGQGYLLEFTADQHNVDCPSCGRHAPLADVVVESFMEVGRELVGALACLFCGQRGTLLSDNPWPGLAGVTSGWHASQAS